MTESHDAKRTGVSVRSARVSDADDIARLTTQLGYDADASDVAARLSRILARPRLQFLVAEVDGRPAGWVHAEVQEYVDAERFVVIGGLVVDASHRGMGIGRLLMATAEEWARGQGCSIVRLSSNARRVAAHRFYEQIGYTNIKTQYSFAKSLDGDGLDRLQKFVPRVDGSDPSEA